MFAAQVTYWRWPGKATASKRFFADGGAVGKESPRFQPGLGEVRRASLTALARLSQSNEVPAVLLYGVPIMPYERFVLVSRDQAAAMQWRANRLFPKVPPETPVLTRTLDVFTHQPGEPSYMLIDVDRHGLQLQHIIDMLCEACPELRVAPMVAFPSGSGFVHLEGEPARGTRRQDDRRAAGELYRVDTADPGARPPVVSGVLPAADRGRR